MGDIPANGYKSMNHETAWPIPSTTPEGYLFFELTLSDQQGTMLSRRMYWLRILQMLADPAERKQWQSAPVPEPLNQTGPWLIPQVQSSLHIVAFVDSARRDLSQGS